MLPMTYSPITLSAVHKSLAAANKSQRRPPSLSGPRPNLRRRNLRSGQDVTAGAADPPNNRALKIGAPVASRWSGGLLDLDRKSTRLNSSHLGISYAVFC